MNFHAKDLQDHFHENPFHLFNYQPSVLSATIYDCSSAITQYYS